MLESKQKMNKLDINTIAESYARMSDRELEISATRNSAGLRPEIIEIIKKELFKRKMNLEILYGVMVQNSKLSMQDILKYAYILRTISCPYCRNPNKKINATITYTVQSFLIVTTSKKAIKIGCPECLEKQNKEAILSTAVLGWWGFPWGIINTPIYIWRNFQEKKHIFLDTPNNTFLSFTLSRIGEIETYKNDKLKLNEIIEREF